MVTGLHTLVVSSGLQQQYRFHREAARHFVPSHCTLLTGSVTAAYLGHGGLAACFAGGFWPRAWHVGNISFWKKTQPNDLVVCAEIALNLCTWSVHLLWNKDILLWVWKRKPAIFFSSLFICPLKIITLGGFFSLQNGRFTLKFFFKICKFPFLFIINLGFLCHQICKTN